MIVLESYSLRMKNPSDIQSVLEITIPYNSFHIYLHMERNLFEKLLGTPSSQPVFYIGKPNNTFRYLSRITLEVRQMETSSGSFCIQYTECINAADLQLGIRSSFLSLLNFAKDKALTSRYNNIQCGVSIYNHLAFLHGISVSLSQWE